MGSKTGRRGESKDLCWGHRAVPGRLLGMQRSLSFRVPEPQGKERQADRRWGAGRERDRHRHRGEETLCSHCYRGPRSTAPPCGDEQEAGSHPTIHYQRLCIQPADKWANQGDPAPRTAAVLLATSDKDSGLNYPPLAASPSGLVGPRRLPCSVSLCLWAKWSSTCSGVSSREIHCRSPHPEGNRA